MTAINSKSQYNDRSTNSDSHSGLFYLLVGAGIGAVTALLLAPKSGADIRGDISELAQKSYDQTAQVARRVKEQSAEIYQTVREKAADVLDLAGVNASDVKDSVEAAVDGAGENVSAAIQQLEEKYAKKDSNATHKSSSMM